MTRARLTDFKQPDCTCIERTVSWTGRYMGFYGHHYHEGNSCFVVGVSDQALETLTERHYNDKTCVNIEAAKYASNKYWEELSHGLKKGPSAEQEDKTAATSALQHWFERYDEQVDRKQKRDKRHNQRPN